MGCESCSNSRRFSDQSPLRSRLPGCQSRRPQLLFDVLPSSWPYVVADARTQQEAQQHLADIVKITNSAIVWSGGLLKIIPYGDEPLAGYGSTYVPNVNPIYSLGEDDFIVQASAVGENSGVSAGGPALRSGSNPITGGFTDDPVRVVRSTPADANNSIQLECLDRANYYNTAIVEAFDQRAIELFGVRRDSSLK